MRRLFYGIVLAVCAGPLFFGQLTLTQNLAGAGPIRTGFAVVTPLSGTGQGLSVSEIFAERTGGNVFQASVLPSPLVTLTHLFVNWDVSMGLNTGIAIVNPNDTATPVTLNLLNDRGAVIAIRSVTLEGKQQLSRFATELFAGIPELPGPFSGLLFIRSDVPVGVMGLFFDGPSFSSLPVAAQLSTNNVVIAGPAPSTLETSVAIAAPGTEALNNPVVPPFPPVVSLPITGITTPLVNATGQTTPNVPPANAGVAVVVGVTGTAFPQLAIGIGGNGALLMPQVATGGGWESRITIANTSTVAQVVRVDFFDPAGLPLALPFGSTVPNVVVPPGGLVTLSTGL